MTCHDLYADGPRRSPRLVVGVDGSPGSYAAMRWAVDQARMAGATVVAIYVLEPVVPLDFTGAGFTAVSQLDTRELHRAGREVIDRVVADAADGFTGEVQRLVIEHANPGQALVRAARDASLLVVGTHRHHGLGFLLGSTGASCVRHATCPVVVIPENWYTPDATATSPHREEVLT
jgi:nucleotide-binding universal stress UspA family protein